MMDKVWVFLPRSSPHSSAHRGSAVAGQMVHLKKSARFPVRVCIQSSERNVS